MTRRPLLKITVTVAVLAAVGVLVVWGFIKGRHEAATESQSEQPVEAPLRVAVEDGQTVVTLDRATQERSAIAVTTLEAHNYQERVRAYGTVVQLPELITLRATMEKAQAIAAASRHESERLEKLHQENQNVSAKSLQAAEAQAGADAADVQAAQAQARQRWGGVIARWLVQRSQELDRLVQGQEVLIQITLPAGVALSEAPDTASIQTAAGNTFAARLVSPTSATDPHVQGQSFFYIAAAHPAGLLPGMNIVAELPVGARRQGVLVPATAVVWNAGKAWVYVQKTPEQFVRRASPTDQPAGNDWFVATGLTPGEKIVVNGAQLLLSEEFRARIQVGEEANR